MSTMSRPNNERNVQFFLILANLPESVLRQPPGENWKPVKDLIYSHIHSEDREYGRIDIADGVAICRMHDEEQRREAYDALQGMSWRNMTLKAWLCEKRGNIMEQSAGPVDPRSGNIIPAPGHLMRMTPSLAGRVACLPFTRPLPSPPFAPQYGTPSVPPLPANVGRGKHPPRAHSLSAYDMNMGGCFPQTFPSRSQRSSTSGMSASFSTSPFDTVHRRLQDDPSLASTAYLAQADTSSGRNSASGSSSTSTSGRESSANSDQNTTAGHPQGVSSHNKIKTQNFNHKVSMTDLQHYSQHTHDLGIVRKGTRKGNGRSLRVSMTFHTDEDTEITVQRLNGCVVGGRKLSTSVDLQRDWQSSASTGKPSPWNLQNPLSARRTGGGKLQSSAMARKDEATPNAARKGPVIIDGSQE